jgi:hypothetical protein
MAWQDFNATNTRGTCIWCGRDLRSCPRSRNKRGEYGDNLFCNLRCGYQFGLTLARGGKRLTRRQPIQAPPPTKKSEGEDEDEDEGT